MELRTQAVDRLLESIAPSLAAELDRVRAEAREQLELEFQTKLDAAMRDHTLEAQQLADVRMDEAVLRAREETRTQLTKEFDEQLRQSAGLLRQELEQKSEEAMQAAYASWSAERSQLQEQLHQWHVYAEAQRLLADCTSQGELLSQFLKLSEPFANSLAIYIAKNDGLTLWRSRGAGNGAFPDSISPDSMDPELYFKPALVREKTVAAVSAVRPCRVESLDFLMSCFERAIETFGLKLQARGPRPPIESENV